ncbi:undecaprenyl-diphosphate phosphatase [Verticiella sediminum]|uniref:Undecaprenyl-diphosphatase n=1 Tax=Verticiella sediminum TaxID=1247510 RepID=A0A556AY50_9BURK|nr:undecaprenyl-diphosphate phosphatase [Verticiella sediminum]TSH97883.1 undecaprenyl-diphosphate phosphatase [Verticiella sediminum]
MDFLQIVVLALVQGLTEFLPISSSAHLLLVPVLVGWPDQGLAFDVALHVGTLLAVLGYFRHELVAMARDWIASLLGRGFTTDAKLAWAVLLGTIPVGLAGLLLKDVAATYFRSPVVLAVGMIAFGLLLGWVDWRHRGERTEREMRPRDVVLIAFAQVLALIPGTSRSGVTLTAGMYAGLTRQAAARFSFLLSIPVIVLAGALEARELAMQPDAIDWRALIWGAGLSAVAAYLCINVFVRMLGRMGLMPFVVYRVILGVVLLAIYA